MALNAAPEALPKCLAEFKAQMLGDHDLGTRYQVSLARLQQRTVLSFIEKKTVDAASAKKNRQAVLRVAELIDDKLLEPKCTVKIDDILFITPHRYSYAIKAADISALKEFRENAPLWQANIWMRISRVNVR